ncbi:MAG: Lsa36 family surface (lipo)protein [Spirochaetaceae bacterium]
MRRWYLVALLTAVSAQLSAVDVEITVPRVIPQADLQTAAENAGIDITRAFDEVLRDTDGPVGDFESRIENDPNVQRFSELGLLSEGFANAGATASHLGTPRAFSDYRSFAFILGTGAAVTAPGIEPDTITSAAESIEDEGDIYLGAGVQPLTAGLGVNISRWVDRTRVYLKVGYFDIPYGTLADEVAFNSLSVGGGASYQLLRTRQLPIGFLRWRGLTLSSGLLFQRNRTDIDIEVDEDAFSTADFGTIEFGDLGFTDDDLSGTGLTAEDPFGTLEVSPTLTAAIESRTYSIPLEASTGVRILWLVDVNLGAGVDLVFGSSELSLGADAEANFVPSQEAGSLVSTEPGSASFNIRSEEGPQLLRPRLTGGVGVNLGPVKLDVPVMLFFDSEGNSAMAGVNLGIVW